MRIIQLNGGTNGIENLLTLGQNKALVVRAKYNDSVILPEGSILFMTIDSPENICVYLSPAESKTWRYTLLYVPQKPEDKKGV